MNIAAVNGSSGLWSYRSVNQPQANQPEPAKVEQNAIQKEAVPELAAHQQVATVSQQAGTVQENPTATVAQSMAPLAAQGVAAASRVSTNTSIPDLYNFSNKYLYSAAGQDYAKIDANQDGVWDRTELEAYADDYYKATGKTLDVDDILQKYGTGGLMDYTAQKNAYNDDALGISYVRDELLRADMGISNGRGRERNNEAAHNDFVKNYTYGYPGKMYAKIDGNDDGVWTLDELTKYAQAYEKATGIRLDAEALFAKYDRNGSGTLTYSEMNEMYRDDALGLSRIKNALDNAKTQGDKDAGSAGQKGNSDKLYNTLTDMWGSKFTKAELGALATSFSKGMQQAAMLDAFVNANNFITFGSSWGRYGGFSGSNTYTMAGNISMLNMFL